MHGFPATVSAEEVRKFLEQNTGPQTVHAVEIEQLKEGDPTTHVNVKFTDKKSVETILLLVTQNLSYGDHVLNATEIKHDILPKQRNFSHSLDDIAVHFGCQTSKNKLSVLWEHQSASVKFGFRLRKMFIFFHYLSVDYKLQISSESMSRIELHHSDDLTKKLLLFQVSFLHCSIPYFSLWCPNPYEKIQETRTSTHPQVITLYTLSSIISTKVGKYIHISPFLGSLKLINSVLEVQLIYLSDKLSKYQLILR